MWKKHQISIAAGNGKTQTIIFAGTYTHNGEMEKRDQIERKIQKIWRKVQKIEKVQKIPNMINAQDLMIALGGFSSKNLTHTVSNKK